MRGHEAVKLECFGAVGEVTGSCHLLSMGGRRLLLDCGLFQGGEGAAACNHAPFPFAVRELDAVFLSHAHLDQVLEQAAYDGGNVLIPAFAVGRTQLLLELFARYYREWEMGRWQVYRDSPMAIEASAVYLQHAALFSEPARGRWAGAALHALLPQLHLSSEARTALAEQALVRLGVSAVQPALGVAVSL